MVSLSEKLKHFQEMKWSEIIDGRKKDLMTWVIGKEHSATDDATIADPATPDAFSFNTTLFRPYFKNLSHDPKTLPFIEFSAIGLLRLPPVTNKEALYPSIQKLLNREIPYHDIDEDYLDIPLIIATDDAYYLYGNTNGEAWSLTALDAEIIGNRRLHFTPTPLKLEYHLQHFPIYHHIIDKKAHTHFSTQPQQAEQLQKIINTTFYIQSLLIQAESINLTSISGLYNMSGMLVNYVTGATYESVYRAIKLLSDTEIDFAHRFKDEVAEFLQLLERFNHYSTMTETTPTPVPGVYQPSTSFQIGQGAGFITRYIHAPNGQWDIDVFSQFSADLPKHIDMLTTLINANNSTVTQHAPNIDASQLRALQKEATRLLKTLKATQKNTNRSEASPLNPLYQMYQIINYAFLIRQIIVLLTRTLTQIGQLNEAYQESLRDILTILQDDCFPLLRHYATHAEVELILKPGTLSRPLQKTMNSYYAFVTDRIKNLANFSFLGQDLLTIENSRFLSQCTANVDMMFQESQQAQQKIGWAQEALTNFLAALEHEDRVALRTHYAWLAPYVDKINPKLNTRIISDLSSSGAQLNLQHADVRLLRCQLTAYLLKLQNTEKLRADQCLAVRSAIPQIAELQLFPYHARTGCDIALTIVENLPLNQLKLPMVQPILIQHRMKSETNYVFYGNTDGTKWGFTPIGVAFIDPGILNHFARLRRKCTAENPNPFRIVIYRTKYESLYRQMILRKAHTHYRSQFNSLESEALGADPHSLVKLLFKPVDWAQTRWNNEATPAPQVEAPSFTVTTISQYQNYYANLEELSAEQAMTVYGWYQQKISNYHDACNNLTLFKEFVTRHFSKTNHIRFTEKTATQQQCQYWYHSLRPYLLGIRNFPEFDQKMVAALSPSTEITTSTSGLSYYEFNQTLQDFSLDRTQGIIAKWGSRATALLDHAHTAFCSQHQQALAPKSVNFIDQPRNDFLLKTTKLSEKIQEFHSSLRQWVPILNLKIQHKLRPQGNGVPYPDIANLKDQLRHPPFILFFKRLFNAAYHLEHLASGLEKIRTDNTENIQKKTIDLIIKIGTTHGQGLCDIGFQLRDDPLLFKLCEDLYAQYTYIVQQASNLIQPYVANVNHIHPQEKSAAFPGIWYTMNFFYTFPAHLLSITGQDDPNLGYGMTLITDKNRIVSIPDTNRLTLIHHRNRYYIYSNGGGSDWQLRALTNELVMPLGIDFSQSYLGYDHRYQPLYEFLTENNYHRTQLNTLQISAKHATQSIEQIIKDANRYFKLFFFDGVMIYQLNQNLQAQLQVFRLTAQNVAMSHLELIQSDYFTPLMIKADTKEHEWGLLPGTITNTLQTIQDEWYQGLIFPLEKTFLEKQTFCTQDNVLRARITAEEQRLAALSIIDSQHQQTKTLFATFISELSDFQTQHSMEIFRTPTPYQLKQTYLSGIQPILHSHRDSFIHPWIGSISPILSRENLRAIKIQVSDYHARLSKLFLLHTSADRKLCEALPIFLEKLNTLQTNMDEVIPEELMTQYGTEIAPKLQAQRKSCVPAWLGDIKDALDRKSLESILEQAKTYAAHLEGVTNTQNLYRDLSAEKLAYLKAKHVKHTEESIPLYRQSFAKHHFHTYVNRLPYQASGLANSRIHREYHRELTKFLIQHEETFLLNIRAQEEVDLVLNEKLQEKVAEFKQQYFERYERFDRLQTAINEFKNHLIRDARIPQRLRAKKMDCLKSLEDILYHNRENIDIGPFLNERTQLLHQIIHASEAALLEHQQQFITVWDWLVDCVISLFTALGLYTPERQRRYADLVNANQSQTNPPAQDWAQFFRSCNPSTPARGAQIRTPGPTPSNR